MGILNNTVSLCQFAVVGTAPAGDLAAWVAESLAGNGFRSIEQTSEELSIGWVRLDDPQDGSFDNESACRHDHYLTFSLRRDQRRLPATLFKAYFDQAQDEFLAANPSFNKVPKQKKEDLREAVRGMLLARTLPTPAIYNAVWDTRRNRVSFASLSKNVVDLFVDRFNKTFDGLRLVPIHPMARAEEVVSDALRPQLREANRTSSEAVLEQIAANQWLGSDFLLWLMHETMNASNTYAVSQPGPAKANEGFTAYLNDRLQLASSSEHGVQKVSVSGPQDNFSEVRTALQGGKDMLEAVLFLEKDELLWKLTLKGELFHFASFKSPAVTLEKDDLTDPQRERQAIFYERMALLEQGLQLFDSLLAHFLNERLAPTWAAREQAIRGWLDAA